MSIKSTWQRVKGAIVKFLLAAAAVIAGWFGHDMAGAQSMTQDRVSWIHPTQYVDGGALPADSIASTLIVWGTTPGGPWPNTEEVAYPTAERVFQRGESFYGNRCYKLATKLKTGAVSMYTPEMCKDVAKPSKEPTDLKVE